MEKPQFAGSLIMSFKCLNFLGKCFSFKAGIQKFSKLIEIRFLQVINTTLAKTILSYSYFMSILMLPHLFLYYFILSDKIEPLF